MWLIIDDRPNLGSLVKKKVNNRNHVVRWRGTSSQFESSLSISDMLDKNASQTRVELHNWIQKEYFFWTQRLSDQSVRDTFGTLEVFSKANFSRASYLNEILKIFILLKKYSCNEVKGITVYSDNPFLSHLLTAFYHKSRVKIIPSGLRSRLNFFLFSYNRIFCSIYLFIYGLIRFFLLSLKKSSINYRADRKRIVFFSYANIFQNSRRHELQRYWGGLYDIINDGAVWALIPVDKFKIMDVFKFLLKPRATKKENSCYLSDFIGLGSLFNVSKKFFKLAFFLLKALYVDRSFSSSDHNAFRFLVWVSITSKSFFEDLLWSDVACNFVREDPPEKIFFLFENQPWERSLVCLARHNFSKSICFGVCHSTVRFWDLRYQLPLIEFCGSACSDSYLPNYLICNGRLQSEMLVDGGWSKDRLLTAEALRFDWLLDIHRKCISTTKRPVVIGFVGEYEKNLLDKQVAVMSSLRAKLNKNAFNMVFKSHPMSAGIFDEAQIDRCDSLLEFLTQVDVVVCWHVTSVSFDAWLLRIPVVLYLEEGVLNLSPVRGFSDVVVARDELELLTHLDVVCALKAFRKRFKGYVHIGDPELPRWRSIALGEVGV